ncbi:MAG: hypothetical protein GY710_00865, partial [Desulfobacteraceae bacterium]|nr:hypothetical protein [Desulfobacteraceae bacterium]
FQKVSAEWSYSTTNSYSETVGATTSVNSTVSNTSVFSLIVPAKAIYAMKGTVYQSTASFPYTATFKNPYDDRLFYMTGQLDNATSISTYTQWLNIGYVDDDGNKIIYDKYKDDWGPYNLSLSTTLAKPETPRVFTLNTKKSLGIDSITIPMDDPGWMMSEKEVAFRQQNGLN